MSDRKLLEAAARAAGMVFDHGSFHADGVFHLHDEICENCTPWNPLADDGDALRLAVKLSMSVEISEHEASTYAYAGNVPRVYAMELWRDNKDAGTRRCIVRAAAEISKATASAGEGV